LDGPSLQVYVLFDDARATWRGDVQVQALVPSQRPPCDATTVMCPGSPGNFDSEVRPIGALAVRRSE
jgi:hypothetical protein